MPPDQRTIPETPHHPTPQEEYVSAIGASPEQARSAPQLLSQRRFEGEMAFIKRHTADENPHEGDEGQAWLEGWQSAHDAHIQNEARRAAVSKK